MKTIEKLLVANRSEVAIRVFRTAHEMGIKTVAVYSHEDRYALHRFKADEAYELGKPGEPIRAYLDIPGIIQLAKRYDVNAIHPGYGFLSENPDFCRACQEAGITFVGPSPELLSLLGDKTAARNLAQTAGVPILAGNSQSLKSLEEAQLTAAQLGFPVIMKASKGGGGRGMRVIRGPQELPDAFEQAQREALTAFGSADVFLEKFIARARHIEVQLIGDQHGNLVHLHERDCSVQRRHQKVVEIAPAPNLPLPLKQALCDAAVRIGQVSRYQNAGTVEFLVDADSGQFYFIEVNPRIQVEHTVTEAVTGVDVVRTQILVALGHKLSDPEISLGDQNKVQPHGFALQCRVTTEDAENGFLPDYGKITHYRSAGGMGVRLDAGTAFSGAVVTPYYDSLLVKVTTWGREFTHAASRMARCLQEFRVRGVKTNIPFLINLVHHAKFLAGECTTRFIDTTPELLDLPERRDRASKIMRYLGEVIVNGNTMVRNRPSPGRTLPAELPKVDRQQSPPPGTRDLFKQLGPKKFCDWILAEKRLLLTDTTFRDAHQSLFATRMRTYDMLAIAPAHARLAHKLFSLEMWGGATFDTSMRFLKESPWQRLAALRKQIPNLLFQMLLRASNAVGYTNYPDNIVREFVKEAYAGGEGVDLFRVFDSLNWVPNMRVAMEAVVENGGLCEAAICYTGDLLNDKRSKYNLKYYVEMAKELEKLGAHILAIKDMAGLCKPYAAATLVKALKDEIGIPIHFHTHDMSGIQGASIVKAAEAGLDIADACMAPMSGGTSQPNLNSLVEGLRFVDRDTQIQPSDLLDLARYWGQVRGHYSAFETQLPGGDPDFYIHEMPGGQATNLYEQAKALGLSERWVEVVRRYAEVNQFLGDIVKVTPSSKAVGDMALFLVSNDMTTQDLLEGKREFAFPESIIDLVSGKMGQPPGGFPPQVQKAVLKDRRPLTERPGKSLAPADFSAAADRLVKTMGGPPSSQDVVTYLLYPRVFEEFVKHIQAYSDTSCLPTINFFYGLQPGGELRAEIETGKVLIIKFLTTSDLHPDGTRTVFFEMNGQPREVTVEDLTQERPLATTPKAELGNPAHVGAPMPGMVVTISVQNGDQVTRGQKLLTMEAMKMETTLTADLDCRVEEVLTRPGTRVEAGDLLMRLKLP